MKISNTTVYPTVTPVGTDYVLGTDSSDGDATKNFTLADIATYVLGAPPAATLDTVCLIGASTTTGIAIAGDLVLSGDVPSSASDTGTAGTIIADTGYIYVCTATDTWKRVSIATW